MSVSEIDRVSTARGHSEKNESEIWGRTHTHYQATSCATPFISRNRANLSTLQTYTQTGIAMQRAYSILDQISDSDDDKTEYSDEQKSREGPALHLSQINSISLIVSFWYKIVLPRSGQPVTTFMHSEMAIPAVCQLTSFPNVNARDRVVINADQKHYGIADPNHTSLQSHLRLCDIEDRVRLITNIPYVLHEPRKQPKA